MNYSSNDGFRLLLSAIKGDDRKVITQFLNNPTYVQYLNSHKSDIMYALSFNGDFDLFRFVREKVGYLENEEYINAYSLALGYRYFKKPERYLELLKQIGKFNNLFQDLAYLIKLADCDILSFPYHSPQTAEIYPQKSYFLLFAFPLILESLDCVAWVIRTLKTLNLSEEENLSLLEKFQSYQRNPCSTANCSVYRERCVKSWNLLYLGYFKLGSRK